jgi:hypothetical protein
MKPSGQREEGGCVSSIAEGIRPIKEFGTWRAFAAFIDFRCTEEFLAPLYIGLPAGTNAGYGNKTAIPIGVPQYWEGFLVTSWRTAAFVVSHFTYMRPIRYSSFWKKRGGQNVRLY